MMDFLWVLPQFYACYHALMFSIEMIAMIIWSVTENICLLDWLFLCVMGQVWVTFDLIWAIELSLW